MLLREALRRQIPVLNGHIRFMKVAFFGKLKRTKWIEYILIPAAVLLGFIWLPWIEYRDRLPSNWEDFISFISIESDYNIGRGFRRPQWVGKTREEVIQEFGKPEFGQELERDETVIYYKRHFWFTFRDGKVQEAFDRALLDKYVIRKFEEGKRMEEWEGKNRSDLVKTYGEISEKFSTYLSPLPYFREQDGNSIQYDLVTSSDRHLAFHIRNSDGLIVAAYDRSAIEK